jgi:hypothetical protein
MYIGFEFQVVWHDEDVLNLYVSAWNSAFGGLSLLATLKDIAYRLRISAVRDGVGERNKSLKQFGEFIRLDN